MKWFSIGLVFLITVLPYGHGYYSSTGEKNSRKISTLENQVKILTNELKALKEDVKELKGETTSESDLDLMPLEASRTMLPDGRVRFTLKYKARVAILGLVFLQWLDTKNYIPIQETFSNEIPNLPPDVFESSVEMEASNTTHVTVSLGNFDFWYRLNMKNALEGNAVQHVTALPDAYVTPLGDIVYEPGTNASIQLTGPLEERSPDDQGFDSARNMDLHYYINPPGSDEIFQKYGNGNVLGEFIGKGEEHIFFDKREITIIFNTSITAYSGLVIVMFGQTYRNDLVDRIEKNYVIPLRPSNQSGAFREDLLTVPRQPWMETNENGDQVKRCRPDVACQVQCQVFGNNPNQVVMLRTVNGVTQTIIPTSQEKGNYSAFTMDIFYMASNPNPINYTCVGSNAGGQRVVNTYMVYLDNPPTFLDNQTSVRISPEGEVNATCTGAGSPLPQMDIRFILPSDFGSEHRESNLEVLHQTNNTISVSKIMTLHGAPVEQFVDEVAYSLFVYCRASSTGGESTKQLTVESIDW